MRRAPRTVLGVNVFHGDASAALIRDGALVAAIEEERFRRLKHVAGVPTAAIRACLQAGGVEADAVDIFAVSRRPRANWTSQRTARVRARRGGTSTGT